MIVLSLLNPETHQPLQKWSFSGKSAIRIGRHRDNDIVLAQFLAVSRHHLELQRLEESYTNSRWQLISYGSNGTFVNGRLVSQTILKDSDLIQLAPEGPLLQFRCQATEVNVQKTPVEVCTHLGNPPTNLFCIHCGKPIVKQQHFIRHYQVLRILGRGGMGTTYLAWDRRGTPTDSPLLLVLKEMNADIAQIAKARELFEREARILKTLDHSGIPKYYDFFVENGKKYLAMELIHGQNLEQWILEKGAAKPQQALTWAIQACDILAYLHSLKPPLVHRDVKPANLMLRKIDNCIMLLDFGAVKEVGTPQETRIGAQGYSAPEQSRGKPCPQSDLYAIGATLIFLLTGEAPLKYYRRLGEEWNFDVSRAPNIPPQLGEVIVKACRPQWYDRYQSAQDLSQALTDCLERRSITKP
ncbi:MAG: protein kinase [Hydrococcus sp. C42_A2020_068]|uniref:FHA domain-containing serine/threonine-protein kinase n=1 Tax=Pleurocapsa sp. PCC 7327 TaxID=118163 RepID=UPI00029F89A1|nr:FHA domain-containing serine/threonine-protein kinase [Pleurocapsa sp. PCC 7327]AFY79581.1 protein kinase domain with FHA domain [Pleurocapsa sp. PCC 7327]MBF2021156.1 protein kinase [Hydrococcus sp. C42_A2020_068]